MFLTSAVPGFEQMNKDEAGNPTFMFDAVCDHERRGVVIVGTSRTVGEVATLVEVSLHSVCPECVEQDKEAEVGK